MQSRYCDSVGETSAEHVSAGGGVTRSAGQVGSLTRPGCLLLMEKEACVGEDIAESGKRSCKNAGKNRDLCGVAGTDDISVELELSAVPEDCSEEFELFESRE
jgi:hypothetical protein